MTILYSHFNIKKSTSRGMLSTLSILCSALLVSLFLSSYILDYVKMGIRLCFSSVAGSVFPFIIITDIIYSFSDFDSLRAVRYCFEKIFKISGAGIGAFICGILCGFPLGVLVSLKLYNNGIISKSECERLISFSNNTGPAFVISGIGVAMRGSYSEGIILYLSMVISAICVGIINGIGKSAQHEEDKTKKEYFSLTASVRSAGLSTLNICSFVIFFSVICGIIDLFIKNDILLSFILPFVEISNASKMLAVTASIDKRLTLLFTSFAISFSGISCHLQAKSYIMGTEINMKRYYISKLLQGVISVIITFVLIKAI